MDFTPYISAKDLSEMLGVSNRSARRLMEKIVGNRPKLKWAEDENLLRLRNKCLAFHEVLQYTGLKGKDIVSHFERVLNAPPSMGLREADKVVKVGGKWHERTLLFENKPYESIALKRCTYSYVPGLDEKDATGVFGFGFTSFPSVLLWHELQGYYGILLNESRHFKSLERVFYDVAVHEELIGFLGLFCGRKKPAIEIVLVEEMGGLSEAGFYLMVDALGKKLDRRRCLVFLPEALVPEGLREKDRIKGFRRLDGSGFFVAGGVNRWVTPSLKLRWVKGKR
jgi:hypothetical protein